MCHFLFRVELVSNFSTSKKYIQREKSRSEVQDIPRDTSFEPKPILKMLQKLRNDIFPIEGRQEDAEEFLSFILNKMNDEMIEVSLKLSIKNDFSLFQIVIV